jgi:ABC-type nitrate/sulfonate/bicarbonate transport system ATPase subunit
MHSYPAELSGGQRQRVSIAEQLLSSKNFLLMDEPFSGLDILAKKIVGDVIDRVSARDELNTIIFSTHDIESAVMIADTILILGRDRDVNGQPVPGAHIQKEIDLIERNLAWHPDIENRPGFNETIAEIKAIFPTL